MTVKRVAPSSVPTQVFDPHFLRSSPIATSRTPAPRPTSPAPIIWKRPRPSPLGQAVLRQGESLRRGDLPYAVFTSEDTAQLCCAVLPGTGRTGRYVVVPHPDPAGYPVLRDNKLVGHMPLFDPDLIAAMNVADALLSSPAAFAWLLDAAGGLLLEPPARSSSTGRSRRFPPSPGRRSAAAPHCTESPAAARPHQGPCRYGECNPRCRFSLAFRPGGVLR